VTIRVFRTTLADQQIRNLRRRDSDSFGAFAEDLRHRGCAALGYRLTGPVPLSALCVKHLIGPLRVVVAFRSAAEALILLVGPHARDDPGMDIYTLLYQLMDLSPPDTARRTKPPCCDPETGLPAELESLLEELVDRARRLAGARRRR
jgi:hypothetical protein